MIKSHKVLSLTELFNTRWLKLFQVAYEVSGKTRTWIFASRTSDPWKKKQVDAVVICAVSTDFKSVVITRELRPAIYDGINCIEYGFPAGLVDENETVEQAAIREFKEETGMDLLRVYHVSPSLYSSPGMTDECSKIVFGVFEGTPSTDLQEETENIEILVKSLSEVEALLKEFDVKWSAKAWPLLWNLTEVIDKMMKGTQIHPPVESNK